MLYNTIDSLSSTVYPIISNSYLLKYLEILIFQDFDKNFVARREQGWE